MVDLFEDEGECREEDIEETDSTLRLYICTSLTPLVTGRVILWDRLEFESRVAWARDLRLVLSGRRDCPFFCGVWQLCAPGGRQGMFLPLLGTWRW